MAGPGGHQLSRVFPRCLAFTRNVSARCTTSLPQHAASMCTDNGTKILGHSTVLRQTGLDIKELPVLIRRMDPTEFPFNQYLYPTETFQRRSTEDEEFKHLLMDCRNINQLLQVLEVPGDMVKAHSAAFALQRLCALQEGSVENSESFLKKAILNELCETVTQNIHELSNETVIGLVRCYLVSSEYEARYVKRINEELEKRIGDSAFTISELCMLINTLYGFVDSDRELAENVWIHLGSRFIELDEVTLPDVYRCIHHLPQKLKYIWSLLDKQLVDAFWKLNAEDVMLILQCMTSQNHKDYTSLLYLSKWMVMNIHALNDDLINEFVTTFSHFHFVVSFNVVQVLARYISAKVHKVHKSILGNVMDYFLQCQIVNPEIFNEVALDFEKNSTTYSCEEAIKVLRPFGKLYYQPPNRSGLFQVIENMLDERFDQFNMVSMIELLASFVYIQRFPINHIRKVLPNPFRTQLKSITNDTERYQAAEYLMELQAAITVELPQHFQFRMSPSSIGLRPKWKGQGLSFSQKLGLVLPRVIGNDFTQRVVPKYTPHFIDYLITVLPNGEICQPEVKRDKSSEVIRLALVCITPHDKRNIFTIQPFEVQKALNGRTEMKLRHLRKLGYTVIQIDQDEAFKVKSKKALENHVRMLLSPYVDFSKVKTVDEVPMPSTGVLPETDFIDDQLLEPSVDQGVDVDVDDVKCDLDEHPELVDHDDTDTW